MSNQLTTNQTLTSGNYLLSPNGQYAAIMHTNGNFVLCYTRNGAPDLTRPFWSAADDGKNHYIGQVLGGPYYAKMQDDANFVLYNGTPGKPGPAYWATSTAMGREDYTAVLQDDANFVIYAPEMNNWAVWATGTAWLSSVLAPNSSWPDALANDGYLLSANRQYAAYLQSDANFVLCYTKNGLPDLSRPYWSAASDATDHYVQGGKRLGAPYYAIMQADGNFVLYNGTKDKPGPPYWATNTSRAAGQFTAVLQDDGNFVIRTPDRNGTVIWASGSNWVSRQVNATAYLGQGQWLANDGYIRSPGGQYAAYLQDDGNFVFCYANQGLPDLSRPYWSAWGNTSRFQQNNRHGPPYYLLMQPDGNLVLYNGTPGKPGDAIWATDTELYPGPPHPPPQPPPDSFQYFLLMQDSGNCRLAEGDPEADTSPIYSIWDSQTVWASMHVTSGEKLYAQWDGSFGIYGQWLSPGYYLASANGQYAAFFKQDGHLVLCQIAQGVPQMSTTYWTAPGNPGNGPFFAMMQADGNFVLYHGDNPGKRGSAYWATGTNNAALNKYDQLTLLMQNDANLVLYGRNSQSGAQAPLWASNTVR